MHFFEDMAVAFTAGVIFIATIVACSMGLWHGLNYNPIIAMALVALYGIVQLSRTQLQNPKQSFRGIWFIFWFENEWYKLVLLLTGMWALVNWV